MADAAQVAIMNTALALLGQEPVADLDEAARTGSVALTKLLRHMDTARDVVLARHGWVCALEYVTLSAAVIPGYTNWRYPTVFYLPGNALRVWEIDGCPETDWGTRWQAGTVETGAGARRIVRAASAWNGGVDGLSVAYVRRANWASLDIHVADAVAHDLASRGCYAITGDKAAADRWAQRAETRAVLAVSTDGTQEGGQPGLSASIPARLRAQAR